MRAPSLTVNNFRCLRSFRGLRGSKHVQQASLHISGYALGISHLPQSKTYLISSFTASSQTALQLHDHDHDPDHSQHDSFSACVFTVPSGGTCYETSLAGKSESCTMRVAKMCTFSCHFEADARLVDARKLNLDYVSHHGCRDVVPRTCRSRE